MTDDFKLLSVGFQKTGTTSLTVALQRLGYSVGNAWRPILEQLNADTPNLTEEITRISMQRARQFDAIQDAPYAFFYEELDREFPNAKFVLTVRESASWIRSMRSYFPDKRMNFLRSWMYGVDQIEGNEERVVSVMEKTNNAIRDHFSDRPDKLLVLDLKNGDGWFELVNFIGRDHLPPFPHENPGRKG